MTGDNRTSRTLSLLHQFLGNMPGVMNVKAMLRQQPLASLFLPIIARSDVTHLTDMPRSFLFN